MELTEKQAECLTALHDFAERNGYPPTMAELGKLLGVSESTAHAYVKKLRRLGYLTSAECRTRATRLTRKGEALFRKG